MKTKALFLIVSLIIISITACAPPMLEPQAAFMSSSLPAEIMLVQPEGSVGELIVYDMDTGEEHHRLPAGYLTTDETKYLTADRMRGITTITLYNLKDSGLNQEFTLDGEWLLEGISTNGRWLVLVGEPGNEELDRRQSGGPWQTEIVVFDSETGETTNSLTLDGHFEIDTISSDGKTLFLIEQLPAANPDHYLIRAYDLSLDELLPDALRDKRFLDELMVGYPWGSINDPAGEWYLTLYINTQHDKAFVHALDMVNRISFCIDLPSGDGNFESLQQYSLAVAPDRTTIYAANAALGIVAEIDMEYSVVNRQKTFPAHPLPARFEDGAGLNASAITADGKTLFFTDGRQLWSYDTASGAITEQLLESDKGSVQGLTIGEDSQQLYVARAERPLLVLPIQSTFDDVVEQSNAAP